MRNVFRKFRIPTSSILVFSLIFPHLYPLTGAATIHSSETLALEILLQSLLTLTTLRKMSSARRIFSPIGGSRILFRPVTLQGRQRYAISRCPSSRAALQGFPISVGSATGGLKTRSASRGLASSAIRASGLEDQGVKGEEGIVVKRYVEQIRKGGSPHHGAFLLLVMALALRMGCSALIADTVRLFESYNSPYFRAGPLCGRSGCLCIWLACWVTVSIITKSRGSGCVLTRTRRANASVHFYELRDHSTGRSVQLVCKTLAVNEVLADVPLESVLQVRGKAQIKKGEQAQVS